MRQLMAQGAIDFRFAKGAKTAIEQNTRAAVFRASGSGTNPFRPFDADPPAIVAAPCSSNKARATASRARSRPGIFSETEGARENSSWLNDSMLGCAARRDGFAPLQDAIDGRDRRFDFGRCRFLA